MKHYQTPDTQVVRLSLGEVMESYMGLSITSGGSNQGSAMAPLRRI